MGQPYVSKKFETGAEFEAWVDAKNTADATLQENIAKIVSGTTEVGKATNSTNAVNANHATSADRAASATYATNAQNAGHATSADSATNAGHANSATKAAQDGNGDNIADTYAKQNGTYANMTVGNATNAQSSTTAGTANKVVHSLSIETSDSDTVAYDGSNAKAVGGADYPVNVARKLLPVSYSATADGGVYRTHIQPSGQSDGTGLYIASVKYDGAWYTGYIYIPNASVSTYGSVILKTGTVTGVSPAIVDNTKWLRLYYNSSQRQFYPVWEASDGSTTNASVSEVVISYIKKIGFVG